jgi:hypothetical protein
VISAGSFKTRATPGRQPAAFPFESKRRAFASRASHDSRAWGQAVPRGTLIAHRWEETMKSAILAGLILMSPVLLSPVLAATASAQQPETVIAFLDKNGDGKCDLNEYLGYQVARIAQFDKDGDGDLNEGEFKQSLQGKAKSNAAVMFKGANSEGGRTLSQKEFLGYHAWVFKTFVDTDKDGFMSQEEWSSIMSKAS